MPDEDAGAADAAAELEALRAENAELKAALEETYEDWKDDEWKNPRARPVPKKGDWVDFNWEVDLVEGKKHYTIALKKGQKKPSGTKMFFWNRDPTKLVLKEIDMEENQPLGVKGGPVRAVYGDVVELTPNMIQKLRPYIEDGSLGPRRTKPVRRSVKTGMKIVDDEKPPK